MTETLDLPTRGENYKRDESPQNVLREWYYWPRAGSIVGTTQAKAWANRQQFRQSSWSVVMLVVTIVVCLFRGALAQDKKESRNVPARFSLSIATEESAVKAGSALWLDVTMENKSDRNISVYRAISGDLDQGGWLYKVTVQDEKGARAPKTKFGRHVQGPETADESAEPASVIASGGYVPLAPHKTIRDRVNVTKLFDLSSPGKYTIQIQEFDEESKTFVKSNKITVAVTR